MSNPSLREDCGTGFREPEVVEVPLLLPVWQVSALETAAHDRGLTAAEMVRSLLREFILGLPGHDRPSPSLKNGPVGVR